MEHLGVNPRGLAVAKCVKSIEADFHPLEEGNAVDVVDRDAVLERKPSMIGAQWKEVAGRQAPQKDRHATAGFGQVNMIGVAARSAVELTVADSDCFAAHVQNLLAFVQTEYPDEQWLRGEFFRQRHLIAAD